MSTHLNVPARWIVNLETEQLNNDNSSHAFYFDREFSSPFDIPTGYSFIITDIIVNPASTNFSPADFYLVLVTVDSGRSITIRCDGHSHHTALTGGLVVPGPDIPSPGLKGLTGRNTAFSTGPVGIQLLGYFIDSESVLPVGRPFYNGIG